MVIMMMRYTDLAVSHQQPHTSKPKGDFEYVDDDLPPEEQDELQDDPGLEVLGDDDAEMEDDDAPEDEEKAETEASNSDVEVDTDAD
jgi:hypothetical protein